jgi:hypothetical protein
LQELKIKWLLAVPKWVSHLRIVFERWKTEGKETYGMTETGNTSLKKSRRTLFDFTQYQISQEWKKLLSNWCAKISHEQIVTTI